MPISLSSDVGKVLHEQVIDLDQPGTVLQDFQMLLDFIAAEGGRGLKAGGQANVLPMGCIHELDRRLCRPLHLSTARPQLRSHPYLHGLNLLLRSSGMIRVESPGKQARLVLDPELVQQWNGLNPTERYFTLLEAWLLRGQASMVGESDRGFGDDFLLDWIQQYELYLLLDEKQKKPEGRLMIVGNFGRSYFQYALLDLFGLAQVEHPAQLTQPRQPNALKRLPFGDALVVVFKEWWDARSPEDYDHRPWGSWQPVLQPYFPEYERTMQEPEAPVQDGTFVFHVSLSAKIWRRLAVPASATLDHLVACILESVEFDNDHLHEISYRDRYGAEVRLYHPISEDGPWTDEVSIGELPLQPGQAMNLLFDFGDSWKFTIKLEAVQAPKKSGKPELLESHGEAPKQYPDWDC